MARPQVRIRVLVPVLMQGSYWVVVTPDYYWHDSGEYGVTASTSSVVGNTETEDNGFDESPDVLTDGQEIKGQLSTSSDVDIFTISAASAGTIAVDFDAPTEFLYRLF